MVKRKDLHRYSFALFLFVAIVFVLAACGAGGEDPGITTLIYAQLSEDGVDRSWLSKFNLAHKGEVQIEVRNYSQFSEGGKQGIDLLMTEIAAGKGPDIIELGTSGETSQLSYRQLAEKGYLEDLWPYIENDPDLGKDRVMEAPLKAAEINGGLYVAFDSFQLHTLVGAKAIVGDRTGWTVEELLEAFAAMPEGSVILDNFYDYSMKSHLLSSFLYGFSDLFIDWETGQCSFDGKEFCSFLELASCMPDEYAWKRSCTTKMELHDAYYKRMLDGLVLLNDSGFGRLYHMQEFDFLFGGVSCIGYPVGDGSTGSYIQPLGIKLAMSSTCPEKEAAWQYIRKTFLPRQEKESHLFEGIPINGTSYKRERAECLSLKHGFFWDGEVISFDEPMTLEACQQIEALYNTPRSSISIDKEILDIVTEVAGAYFAGDKSLDETVQLIQNRVTLYVNEQK